MNTHEINKPAVETYGISCDPLKDIYHEFAVKNPIIQDGILEQAGQVHTTGQPVVVYGDTKEHARDQLFSAWTEDADGNLDTYTEREISVSTNYTEADANTTATEAMDAASGLLTRPIKHPDREEWGMIVSAHILGGIPAGSKKDGLMAKHIDKLNKGHNKTKKSAKSDGWK